MKVIDIINKSDSTLFSFELLPPLKGNDASVIYNTIGNLLELHPQYINITTHRDEVAYKELPNGEVKKQVVRKRPGAMAIAASIQYKYHIPVVPHVLCGGFTKSETEYLLMDMNFLGINNVLALRGDGVKSDLLFQPEENGHSHADELVHQIKNLGKGKYLDPDLKNTAILDFCVGVAGYPEKHFEAPNLNTDLNYLKQKVAAGAEYIVTQMFFDNQAYFKFVDRCRAAGIDVPIIPGLKSISSLRQLTILPKIFHIDLPDDLVSEIARCKTDSDAKIVGTEWAIQQTKELIAAKVPSLHMYTMGVSDSTKNIIKAVF